MFTGHDAPLEDYNKDIMQIDTEMNALYLANKDITSYCAFLSRDGELQTYIKKFNVRIIQEKEKKFKYRMAFQSQQAFEWSSYHNRFRNRKMHENVVTDDEDVVSDASSHTFVSSQQRTLR